MKYITRWGLMNNTKSENISEHSLQVAMFAHFNPDIIASYKKVEKIAGEKLVSMLPEDLRGDYRDLILGENPDDKDLLVYVKAADKLSALVKCIEEIRMGNDEFRQAKESTEKSIHKMNVPEAERFMTEFLPSFSLTLDEQNT